MLLLVDLLWVASSELTKYIFKDENYGKPFFTTYIKTSMFMVYLFGFLVWKPWRDHCSGKISNSSNGGLYSLLEPDNSDDISIALHHGDDESHIINGEPLLSEPMYIPIKFHDGADKSSGNESDDSVLNKSNRSVRFSKLTEVRHLSDMQAEDALLARLSYAATMRAHEVAMRAANKLSVKQVARVAFMFSLLWFIGNLSYQEALLDSEAGIVNLLSCSSGLFTLLLASMFPSNNSDKFTLSKFIAVVISLVGVGLVTTADKHTTFQGHVLSPGAIWTLAGALFYAAYLVFLRRQVDNEDRMDLPMFFGFVGLFNFLLIWPGLAIVHFTKVETFQWPSSRQWALVLINGLIGTVISELLWLWGCFLTSSLIATLAISLTIPLTVLFDILLKQVEYPHLFFIGSLPMLASFFAVTILAHYDNWDPVTVGMRKLISSCWWKRQRSLRFQEADNEQTESLIGVNSEYT